MPKCCFSVVGINSVCFDEESKHITAMKSLEGEVVPFKNKVLLSNNVEVSHSISPNEPYEIYINQLSQFVR